MAAKSALPPTPFAATFAPPDEDFAARFLAARPDAKRQSETEALARDLIGAIRKRQGGIGGIEEFLHEFALSSKEGLAVMALAESLLRVPDDATADRLIIDKLAAGDFLHHESSSQALIVQVCAFALGASARLIGPDETPLGLVAGLARRLGMRALRAASREAIRLVGAHFVFGETIDAALARAKLSSRLPHRYSYDMLGEAARTQDDADRYFHAYANSIMAIGASAGDAALPDRPGISVKLSALHPRYEAISRERVLAELAPRLLELARLAKARDLFLTIDAEEADRLELSLDVFDQVLADSSLAGWDGFGLAVQSYQKRALAVIDHVAEAARFRGRRLMVRLVKGAYWDNEIKRAQERGLADYPVFTRKAMTDLNFLCCADRMFSEPVLYPQFATHNALTAASIVERANGRRDFEFQRLHGMGEALHDVLAERCTVATRIYAPIGPHRDLLAYLVRRLIENGVNSSFVAKIVDPSTPVSALLADPYKAIDTPTHARNARLRLPGSLFSPMRANSKGVEFGDRTALATLLAQVQEARASRFKPESTVTFADLPARVRRIYCPIDGTVLGCVIEADAEAARDALLNARRAFPDWSMTAVEPRAVAIERAADLIESERGRLIALLQDEAGKTLEDAVGEIREAADLCRYYAAQARILCQDVQLPGPTGEDNRLRRCGRGVFVCISPWNFSLAIFVGQIAAALVTGNTVAAKPAEQTPLIAQEAVRLLIDAGVPPMALQLAPGDGEIGHALVADPNVAGVAFTGSLNAARSIHQTLARSNGPIVPLIAETGGVNAMIVDSSALIEQVVDDVLTSAFRSAGQRCSALRLLCVQEEIATEVITNIIGAARELCVGDPRNIQTHVGPVIDRSAKDRLEAYLAQRGSEGRILYAGTAPRDGAFVPPHIIKLDRAGDLREEIFGPVLHVCTWRGDEFKELIGEIAASGYGLTMGLHTRIEQRMRALANAAPAGNVYVNRNMIGAVVGSQPFGGIGLSGTGPKAGGEDYLRRFTREATITINTASLGGDAKLLSMADDSLEA